VKNSRTHSLTSLQTKAINVFDFIVPILNLLILAVLLPAAKLLWTIRTNDMQHIDEKLAGLKEVTDRIDRQLTEHIKWHLEKGC